MNVHSCDPFPSHKSPPPPPHTHTHTYTLTEAGSLMTEAVSPAALLPLPDVYTPMGDTFSTNLSSWLFAVPGSPSNSRLMSPRRVSPSGRRLREPPSNRQEMARLMSAQRGDKNNNHAAINKIIQHQCSHQAVQGQQPTIPSNGFHYHGIISCKSS